MNRPAAALLCALVGTVAITAERAEILPPLRAAVGKWLAGNAPSPAPVTLTAIACDTTDGRIAPLDAALILRAITRFQPAGIAFLSPVADGSDAGLLLSRLQDANLPIVFSGTTSRPPLPAVKLGRTASSLEPTNGLEPRDRPAGAFAPPETGRMFVAGASGGRAVPSAALLLLLDIENLSLLRVTGAIPGVLRAGSLALPVDAGGASEISPLAADRVHTLTLDELMLRIERGERGAISPALDMLFRDRIVVVTAAGSSQAEGAAALWNGLLAQPVPGWSLAFGVALFLALPWLGRRRLDRIVWATAAAVTWVLLALAIYQEFRMVTPIAFAAFLPVLAALPITRRGGTGK